MSHKKDAQKEALLIFFKVFSLTLAKLPRSIEPRDRAERYSFFVFVLRFEANLRGVVYSLLHHHHHAKILRVDFAHETVFG